MAFKETAIKYSSNRPVLLDAVLTTLLCRTLSCIIPNRVKTLFILALLSAVPAIAAVPNDFDRDGVSDITRVEIAADGTLTWKAVFSTNGSSTTLGMLGQEGNQPVMAQWLGAGTQIGVVSEEDGGDGIVWSILDSSGTRINRVFGRKGDLVISGGDFDGNGVADAAVARLLNGRVEWEVAFDLFVSAEPRSTKFELGKAGDRVFFARADDSGVDWVGVVGKGSRNRSLARMRNLLTGATRNFSRFPKLASQGTRPRPFAIRQESGPDLLVFQSDSKIKTRVSLFSFAGARISQSDLSGSGILVVGEFNPGPGYEVAFQGSNNSVVLNGVSGDLIEAVDLGGIAVDEINFSVVGESSNSDSSAGGSSGGSPGSSGEVSKCSSIVGWPAGHIYKTIGSEHFFDIRRNTIGIVVKPGGRGPFPSCVDALDTEGNLVARLGLYAKGAGWAARYYAGVGCGANTPLNGAAVASRARANTGSPRIYMNFEGTCYGPIDAGSCIGSSQC